MIFTLLCIKEFVKNFPFVNKNNPINKAQEEPHKKDTKEDKEDPKEDQIEDTIKDHTEDPKEADPKGP